VRRRVGEDAATLVGIEHGFSFPLRYFEAHRLEPDWAAFLDDFQRHWPTDEDNTYVDFVRHGAVGNGMARMGDARWQRLGASIARFAAIHQLDRVHGRNNSKHRIFC